MARKLFGTDGVRGVAGEFLTAELAMALARAATARVTDAVDHAPRVLVIRDTRESGEMLEAAVAAGVAAAGGEALIGRRAAHARRAAADPPPRARPRRRPVGLAQPVSRTTGSSSSAATASSSPTRPSSRSSGCSSDGPPRADRIGRVHRFHGALEDYLRALHERFEGST